MTILSKCPYCKKDLNGKSNICPHCGGVLFEVVGHPKEAPTIDVSSSTQKTKSQHHKNEEYGNNFGRSTSGNLYEKIRKSWNGTPPTTKFIAFIILLVVIVSSFSNQNGTTTQPTYTPTNKTEEVILPENRLENGTIIYKDSQSLRDDHQITIDNSAGGTDAIVKLVSTIKGSSIYTVYIREGYKYTINNIGNGSYYLYFAYCKGYNYGTQKPLGLYGSQKADKLYNFQTRRDGDYLVSSQLTITLYKQEDGNLTTTSVGEDQFNSY